MVSVHDVAAYILDRRRGPVTAMKLEKLVYYCQAWHLVWCEEPLFGERIEAWANGPVVRELFDLHRGKFSLDEPWPAGDAGVLDAAQRGTVDAVLDNYGPLSGRQLSALTHDEAPWKDARKGLAPTDKSSRTISSAALAEYYSAVDQAEEARPVADLDWDSWEFPAGR